MGECSSSAAKTSVWWDIDKCPVPRGRCDPHHVAYNVIAALAAAGYAGPVSIAAYGDAARVAPPVLHALSATGICLTHVPAGSKDTSDKRMLVDMLFWAFDNPPPGNYLLISGDRDFSDLLYRLKMKRYDILLVRPSNASSQVLAAAAKTVWLWETLAAGNALRPESPPGSSVLGCKLNMHNASVVLGCKPDVSNLDPLKCSQKKILSVSNYGQCDDNVKASNQCRLKPVQKYVKKATGSSSPTENHDRIESIGGIPESSTGSAGSELDQSSVPSSSPTCNSLESMNTSILPEIPGLLKSSSLKHVRSSQPQVEATKRSILGAKPNTLTECVARNGNSDFGGSKRHCNQTYQHQNVLRPEFKIVDNDGNISNRHRVKPFQKYVKKANTPFCSASNKMDSVRDTGCPNGSTKTKFHQSLVSLSPTSSVFVIPKEVKTENLGQPESSTPSHSSAKKSVASAHLRRMRAPDESIFGKKPSISVEHASRNGTHGFNVSTVHSHPAPQQSKSSEAQNKMYPYCSMGRSSGKLSNGYKLNQQQMYVKKVDVLSGSTSNVIAPVNGFPDNPCGSPSNHLSQSMSSSSSKTLNTAKLDQSTLNNDPPSSKPSAQKPAITDNLHQDCSGFIFGNEDSTSVQCTSQCTSPNGNSAFAVNSGHCHSTYQQSQSSLLTEQNISTTPRPHGIFGHSDPIYSQIGSSAKLSAVSNGVSSAHIQVFHNGLTFQGLDDICHGISRLNISDCSRGTGEIKPLFQSTPASYTSMGMTGIFGNSMEVRETKSSFHGSSDSSFFPNHSNDPQVSQPLSSNYTCINVHDMQNPEQHGDKTRYLSNSSDSDGTIGRLLHALDILKGEKIFPTESNIADCIRYGEMNLIGFDVKKALELAIRQQVVVMKKLVNDMPLFVPKDESLWKCVNVTNSKAKNPIEALDTVYKYISSSDGYSVIKNSQSRYQAARLLKESCLQNYALGDILQVLHIIVVRKKWLMPHALGWQPLSLNTTVVISPTDTTGKA